MGIIVATANIQNEPNLTHGNVVRCGEIIASKNPDFVGFQELVEKQDHRDILAGMGRKYSLTDNTQCAIGYNSQMWTLISRSHELATPGVGGITPNLYIVTATFRRNLRQFVTVINTHMVPLTLHGEKRTKFNLRYHMWLDHATMLSKIVDSQKYPTFVTGDFNNTLYDFDFGRVIVDKPLDKIFVNGHGKQIDVLQKMSVNTPSDHNAEFAKVRIK